MKFRNIRRKTSVLESLFNSEYCESVFMKPRKIKNQGQVKLLISLFFFHDWFPLEFLFTYNISFDVVEVNSKQYLIELTKRRPKVQEKNKSCKRALNFDQLKIFSENYKPMRVWLWLVYKFTDNYCHLRLFSEFIQTQKRYPTSLDKISILT